MISRAKAQAKLREDVIAIAVSVVFAWFLIASGVLSAALAATDAGKIFESFTVGFFFTSSFTIAPAAVFLGELSRAISPWLVALFGALGAMVGDLVIFLFIRDRLAGDIEALFPKNAVRRFLHSFHFGFWKWLAPLLGACIIASPLPDEFGLTLLGLSRTKLSLLLPVSFVMNFVGILGVAAIAGLF